MNHARTVAALLFAGPNVVVAAVLVMAGCAGAGSATRVSVASPTAASLVGGAGEWEVRPMPQGGIYVFSARHYSYFYVFGSAPRPRFGDGNRPTDAERAATYGTFIAGAGTYTYDGRTVRLRADFRKNPNEMTGEDWHWELDSARGDTLQFIFRKPPFLPGREWRTTLVRAD